ncbi:MAG: PKD domain-containing protein, partial [Anaerolineae bacterium]|nr:PKD domain-containing protein [Anaerolineae bacterium]
VIAVDMSGNAYILGETSSPNFPTANAVQSIYGGGLDAFVTKLNTTGGFIYSSYFGGSGNDFGRFSPVVDISGNAYIVSGTSSPNFPTVNAVQAAFGGGFQDAFVMKLNTIGGFVYSTYLGGSGVEGVGDFAVDASSNVYVVGFTSSSNFPTANAVQPTLGGFNDPFVFKLAENQPPIADAGEPYSVNESASVTVTASGNDPENGPLTYAWDLDNDGSFEISGQTATFDAANLDGPSTRTIKVQVTDNGGLMATDQATVNVLNVAPMATFTSTSTTIIVGQAVTLTFSDPLDPSAADVAAGFQYFYDCTDDDTFEDSDPAATSHVCTYPASGSFTAIGRVKDKDGGYTDYTVDIVVQTSQEATGSLINQVQALVDAGILNQGQGNGLIAKLEAATQQLDNGNINAAINQLQSFINQVNDFISSTPPILTAAEGQPLLDAANAIIAVLSNPSQIAAAGFRKGASDGLTAVDQSNNALPTGYRLEQNSPNPFNPVTTIQFSVPRESYVRLKVYNSFGAEVATLADRQYAPGTYKINWDASRLATGIYLYRLEAEGFAQTKKLLLMK